MYTFSNIARTAIVFMSSCTISQAPQPKLKTKKDLWLVNNEKHNLKRLLENMVTDFPELAP